MTGFTLAHLSDLHLPFEPALSLLQRASKRQLSAWSWQRRRAIHRGDIVDALASDVRSQAVDHVAISGDLINFSLPEEFRRAAGWLHALAPADRISVVPGNHDALVRMPHDEGLGLWQPWTRAASGWPSTHRRGGITLIGLNSARPTAPLLARGRLGQPQLRRLQRVLADERALGQTRVVLLHHPAADAAVGWRKALADRSALREVLRREGAELLLHGHARSARLDAIDGPREPIPCLCVPSSSALANPQDEGARWHRLRWIDGPAAGAGSGPRVEVQVRRWSAAGGAFAAANTYELCLPRLDGRTTVQNATA